ncbi:hypothetical protein [Arthrobacter globiformis]|uniref:hypothetical protein n=1 Tax=Arthrobacter globiformis TaxID=1665 RepID=UPI002784F43B|nr:hypothetical protein [Arthrobacter globiformis]MDQ0864618.1 hypothetical protein [Arthrobacter globiformis]
MTLQNAAIFTNAILTPMATVDDPNSRSGIMGDRPRICAVTKTKVPMAAKAKDARTWSSP